MENDDTIAVEGMIVNEQKPKKVKKTKAKAKAKSKAKNSNKTKKLEDEIVAVEDEIVAVEDEIVPEQDVILTEHALEIKRVADLRRKGQGKSGDVNRWRRRGRR